jgi:capsular polysaccharide export protein
MPPPGFGDAASPAATGGVYVGQSLNVLLTPDIARFLDAPYVHRPIGLPRNTLALIGWGLKGTSLRVRANAQRAGVPYHALEDGFLRSIGLGDTHAPLSMVVDDLGVYYDASHPSRLEALVARGCSDTAARRGAQLVAKWRALRLSKYNHAREWRPPDEQPFVLVVDQTVGDASIRFGQADASSFARMLEAALDEHPHARVVLKVHPDVVAGRRKGHFNRLTPAQAGRVTVLATDAHPPSLLERAMAVYVVTSQMGFEALMWGCGVRTFGMPFYAGWGLTHDEQAVPTRRGCASLEALVHSALVDYARYIDPETLERCEVERLMDWMGLQRRMRERFPARIDAVRFMEWKQPVARLFFAGSTPEFLLKGDPKLADRTRGPVLQWGRPEELPTQRETWIVEDGFLRSVGLGAHYTRPLSWVVDHSGIYFDATRPSDLETLLQKTLFDVAMIERARCLREAVVASGITKYNVGQGKWARPPGASRVVLLPGQVEEDASIRLGSPRWRTNLELAQQVRRALPNAYIVYKPHPDVVSGRRARSLNEEEIGDLVDEVVIDVPMHTLLDAVDEVHVLTSLAGFEALLRGRPVVCYGSPFYAGWGLTQDALEHPRRQRRLTLDELVAGTLLLYPTYVSLTTNAFTTAERVLYELAHWDQYRPPRGSAPVTMLKSLQRIKRRLKRWARRMMPRSDNPPRDGG